jgi:outer membrane protein OmpA-like peptidoglycan-associated protein
MRFRWISLLLLGVLACCSRGPTGQQYSVYFQPYSAQLDGQARETIQTAADYAQSHRSAPVAVTGYSGPPDPGKDVDGLSVQRAQAVGQLLATAGVDPARITTSANGITDPKAMPAVAVRRVDITVGQ